MSFKFAIDVEAHPKDQASKAKVSVNIPSKGVTEAEAEVAVTEDGRHVAVVTSDGFIGELDETVDITATLLDAAGNESQPATGQGVIKDTIAPGAPQLTLRVTEQV